MCWWYRPTRIQIDYSANTPARDVRGAQIPVTKKKRLRDRCKKLGQALAKARSTIKESIATAQAALAQTNRTQSVLAKVIKSRNKCQRKLASVRRKLEVEHEYVEVLTQHVRLSNQRLAESNMLSERKTMQDLMHVKAMERAIKQQYDFELDEPARKMVDAAEPPMNGKAFRKG